MADPTATVRLLTGLTAPELADDQIDQLLDLHDQVVKLAAADALEIRAGQLTTAVSSDDISIDGSKRAAVLMQRAARLREQAAAEDADGSFFFDLAGGTAARPELTERLRW